MNSGINKVYVVLLSIIVALGGFLLGFDSAVISRAERQYGLAFGLIQDSFWFDFSVAGSFNSLVSYLVVQLFPLELVKFGSTLTFALFAIISLGGLSFVIRYIPETKGKSLEQMEDQLILKY